MSDDRLKELVRQRALLAEHLAWLDREIAAAPGAPSPEAVAAPVPVQPSLPPPVAAATPAPVPPAEVDALFDRFRSEEAGRGQVSKQGCWLVFAALMLVSLIAIGALVFLRYR